MPQSAMIRISISTIWYGTGNLLLRINTLCGEAASSSSRCSAEVALICSANNQDVSSRLSDADYEMCKRLRADKNRLVRWRSSVRITS